MRSCCTPPPSCWASPSPSALAGVPALVAGQPFLTHVSGELALAGIALPWSTVMLFDLGVMLCVWGGLAALVLALWRKT